MAKPEKFHEMVARVHATHPALKKASEMYMKRTGMKPAPSPKVKPITPVAE